MAAVDIARRVLTWFAEREPRLQAQLSAADIVISETTSTGFLASIKSPAGAAPLPADVTDTTLDGCALHSENLHPYAECLLHIRGGQVRSLEIYAVSTGSPADSVGIEIRDLDVNRIDRR